MIESVPIYGKANTYKKRNSDLIMLQEISSKHFQMKSFQCYKSYPNYYYNLILSKCSSESYKVGINIRYMDYLDYFG